MSEDTPRISVSRDALRADLAEMELRLRTYFDAQLAAKAASADLLALTLRVNAVERGDWSPAALRAVASLVEDGFDDRDTKGWSARERGFAWVSAIVTIATFVLSASIAWHGLGG